MLDIYRNGYKKGTPTQVRDLDGVFSFYKTWWYLWHGIPNSGKKCICKFPYDVYVCASWLEMGGI